MATLEERVDASPNGEVAGGGRRKRSAVDMRMTVVQHLDELRTRIILCFVAFAVGTGVAWTFYNPILEFLAHPLQEGGRIGNVQVDGLFVPGIATAFTMRLKVSAFGGVVLGLPVILWQVWRFVTPGLYRNEKRYAVPFVVCALGLFAVGGYLAFLVLPKAIGFLLAFVAPPAKPLIFLDQYLSFVMFMVLAFGITFQYPLLLFFLAAVGIVTSRRLARWRRHAVLAMFIVSAVATPSGDPLSMTMLAAPLYLLYEISLFIIRRVMKK